MGFMDKLKNIFFEEDEEEEIEEPVSPKRSKKEKKIEEVEQKETIKEVIARKVELPKKEKKDDLKELKELEPKVSVVEEQQKKEETIEIPRKELPKKEKKDLIVNQEIIFDDDDFILDSKPKIKNENTITNVIKKEDNNLYRGKNTIKEEQKSKVKIEYQSNAYAVKKEEKQSKSFTPSPIISPIYGILDKNYKKEEVKDNKEIRISSRPSRMDLDSVRNKAFGDLEYDLNLIDDSKEEKKVKVESRQQKHTKEDIQKIYNKKDNEDDKPSIERVTIGEADEYYNDLGLAYNTDYKDLSKDISDGKVVNKKEKEKEKLEDNLFDLIESMYDKE